MKKFLILVILLIPVVVVLALSATGAIIARSTPVNARDIVVKDRNNKVLDADDIITVNPKEPENNFIIVETLPEITYDTSIVYSFDETLEDSGEVKIEREEKTNRFRIIPVKSGVARVFISPKTNSNVTKAITVFVMGNTIKDLVIFNEEGEKQKELILNQPTKLFADINPIEALSGKAAKWEIEDESIAYVSPNGEVFPLKNGRTSLSFNAIDKDGIAHSVKIPVDTTGAIFRLPVIKTAMEIDEDFIKSFALINDAAGILSFSDSEAEAEALGHTAKTSFESAESSEIDFSFLPGKIYTNNGPYSLGVKYAVIERFDESVEARFLSSDESVAKIEGNFIVPIKGGEVEITAITEEGEIKKTLTVRERPISFSLALNAEDNLRGMRQTRVWGRNWFNGNQGLKNTFQFGLLRDNPHLDLVWSVNDEDAVSMDENLLLEFKPESAGKEIIITAALKVHNHFVPLRRSYKFNISEDEKAVNIYSADELLKMTEIYQRSTIVLQNSFSVTRGYNPRADIYGNGYKIDANNWTGMHSSTGILVYENSYLEGVVSEIKIEELTMEGGTSFEESAKFGCAIKLIGIKDIKFSMINTMAQYFNSVLYQRNSNNLYFEGSIFGECGYTTLNLTYDDPVVAEVTFKNIILKKTGGPALMISPNSIGKDFQNFDQMPTFRQQGFLDIYNWMTFDDLSRILDGLDLGSAEEVVGGTNINMKEIVSVLSGIVKSFFEMEENSHLSYYDEATKKHYINMGMFAMGLLCAPNPSKFILEDKGLDVFTLHMPKDNLILTIANTVLPYEILNESYIVSYSHKNGELRNKPGDPIPESKEMYQRLIGYYSEE